MKIIAQALLVLSAMMLTIVSCTRSTTIGADLLEQDQASIKFTDTITLTTATHIEPNVCLLYTSPSPRDRQKSRMPSSA